MAPVLSKLAARRPGRAAWTRGLPAALLALIAAAAIAAELHVWLGTDAVLRGRSDFAPTYVAGAIWSHDPRGDFYDAERERSLYRSVSPEPAGSMLFENPPDALLVAAPFIALPFAAAYFGWTALQLALIVAAVALAGRAAPWPRGTPWIARRAAELVAVCAVPTLFSVMLGQFDGFLTLGVAGAYAAWRAQRPGTAGLALGLAVGLAKPHLALGLLAFAAGRREWRTLKGMAAGAGFWLAVTALGSGPAAWLAFPGAALGETGRGPQGESTLWGLVGTLLGQGPGTLALTAAGECLLLALAAHLGRRSRHAPLGLTLAGAVLLTLLAAVHAKDYDMVVLTPLVVVLFAKAAARDAGHAWPGPRGMLVLGGWLAISATIAVSFTAQPLVLPALAMPATLAALLAALLVAMRRLGVRHPLGRREGVVAAVGFEPTTFGL